LEGWILALQLVEVLLLALLGQLLEGWILALQLVEVLPVQNLETW
jgi:hypothetical protein